MSLTTFRQAVQTALQDAFGFEFVAGLAEGPFEERDVGCVYVQGKREADPITDEEIYLGVRVFKQWKQPEGVEDLPNADDMEAHLELVQTTLGPLVTTLGPWLARVTSLEILWEQSGVEATVVGRQINLAGY